MRHTFSSVSIQTITKEQNYSFLDSKVWRNVRLKKKF